MNHDGDSCIVPAASGLGALARMVCLLIASGLMLLVVVSVFLTPDPGGMGTHQQLGLPPCSVRVLFGIRCPACGMTTSWSYLFRGNIVAALASNVAGVCLGVLSVVGIAVLSRMALTGYPASGATSWAFALGLLGAVTIAVLEWWWRIA